MPDRPLSRRPRAAPRPAVLLTRAAVAAAVEALFANGAGQRASRLVLVDDIVRAERRIPGDLGGYCRGAVVDQLCDHLGVPEE